MGRRQKMVDYAVSVAGDDSHGYSQSRRFPSQGTDFDCSSLMYTAAHEAGYDVPLSGYTGTMLADFQAAGFTAARWDGNIWDCEPGDILLAHNADRQHTEMYVGNGRNVGAHIAETGGVDGVPGDQTGNEISVAPNRGPWDWVLTPPDDEGGSGIQGAQPQVASGLPQPRFRCRRGGKWRRWHDAPGKCGVEGDPFEDFEVDGLGLGGWFQLTLMDGTELARNERNDAHVQHVRGITLYYDTPVGQPLHEAAYRVGVIGGGWLKTEYDDDDGGAGDDVHAVDRFQMALGRCGDRHAL